MSPPVKNFGQGCTHRLNCPLAMIIYCLWQTTLNKTHNDTERMLKSKEADSVVCRPPFVSSEYAVTCYVDATPIRIWNGFIHASDMLCWGDSPKCCYRRSVSSLEGEPDVLHIHILFLVHLYLFLRLCLEVDWDPLKTCTPRFNKTKPAKY